MMDQLQRLLLFSPDVYRTIIAGYNRVSLPIALAAGALVVFGLVRLFLHRTVRAKTGLVLAASLWLWVGIVFHAGHYATINWAADYLALLYIAQGIVLLRHAYAADRGGLGTGSCRSRLGVSWLVIALLHGPVSAWIDGIPILEHPLFGISPQTVIWMTFGIVLMSERPGYPGYLVVAAMLPLALAEVATGLLVGDRLSLLAWLLFAATMLIASLCRASAGRQPPPPR